MRQITKGPEPQSLTAHRKAPFSDYDNYKAKDELRRALVTEQRGICCYCMDRIRDDGQTKIEHWQSRSCHRNQQLVYRNLLAACWGGMGVRGSQQHCDTRKGNRGLSWNPADPSHDIEAKIRYEVVDGSIRSDEEVFNAELDDVLNLNLPILKNHRKEALNSLSQWWQRERERRRKSDLRLLQRERERWQGENGELRPFCQVVIWALDQRIAKLRR